MAKKFLVVLGKSGILDVLRFIDEEVLPMVHEDIYIYINGQKRN